MILDGVVSSAREKPGYGGPFVPMSLMGPEYDLVLGRGKGPVLDLRAELIAPP